MLVKLLSVVLEPLCAGGAHAHQPSIRVVAVDLLNATADRQHKAVVALMVLHIEVVSGVAAAVERDVAAIYQYLGECRAAVYDIAAVPALNVRR